MSTRVIAIDWSGAKRNAAKKISFAKFRDRQPFGLPRNGKDSTEVLNYLVRSCVDHCETVVGIDFAFSFPDWFIADQGCRTAEEMWNRVESAGERWLKECGDPFWGRPGKKNPRRPETEQFRKTDRDFAQPIGRLLSRSFYRELTPLPWSRQPTWKAAGFREPTRRGSGSRAQCRRLWLPWQCRLAMRRRAIRSILGTHRHDRGRAVPFNTPTAQL